MRPEPLARIRAFNEADWETIKVRGTVQEINVSKRTGEVVLLGYLHDSEDEGHNCDAMGCGTHHVIWRGGKRS